VKFHKKSVDRENVIQVYKHSKPVALVVVTTAATTTTTTTTIITTTAAVVIKHMRPMVLLKIWFVDTNTQKYHQSVSIA
jgi:hypothetical protein